MSRTLNVANIRGALQRTAANAKHKARLSSLLKEAAKMQLEFIRYRFINQLDSRSRKWPESKASLIRRKSGGKDTTLMDTGKLFRSLYLVSSKDKVTIASNSPYGKIHHFGLPSRVGSRVINNPARPFMNIADTDEKTIINFLRRKLRARFK